VYHHITTNIRQRTAVWSPSPTAPLCNFTNKYLTELFFQNGADEK
jgi:hypothetical protein